MQKKSSNTVSTETRSHVNSSPKSETGFDFFVYFSSNTKSLKEQEEIADRHMQELLAEEDKREQKEKKKQKKQKQAKLKQAALKLKGEQEKKAAAKKQANKEKKARKKQLKQELLAQEQAKEKQRIHDLKVKSAVRKLDTIIQLHFDNHLNRAIKGELRGKPDWLLVYMNNALDALELLEEKLTLKLSDCDMRIIHGIVETRLFSLNDAITRLKSDLNNFECWLQDTSTPAPEFTIQSLQSELDSIDRALVRVYQFSQRYLAFFRLVEGGNATLSNIIAGIKYVASAEKQLSFWDSKLLMGLYIDLIEDGIAPGRVMPAASRKELEAQLSPLRSILRGVFLKRVNDILIAQDSNSVDGKMSAAFEEEGMDTGHSSFSPEASEINLAVMIQSFAAYRELVETKKVRYAEEKSKVIWGILFLAKSFVLNLCRQYLDSDDTNVTMQDVRNFKTTLADSVHKVNSLPGKALTPELHNQCIDDSSGKKEKYTKKQQRQKKQKKKGGIAAQERNRINEMLYSLAHLQNSLSDQSWTETQKQASISQLLTSLKSLRAITPKPFLRRLLAQSFQLSFDYANLIQTLQEQLARLSLQCQVNEDELSDSHSPELHNNCFANKFSLFSGFPIEVLYSGSSTSSPRTDEGEMDTDSVDFWGSRETDSPRSQALSPYPSSPLWGGFQGSNDW